MTEFNYLLRAFCAADISLSDVVKQMSKILAYRARAHFTLILGYEIYDQRCLMVEFDTSDITEKALSRIERCMKKHSVDGQFGTILKQREPDYEQWLFENISRHGVSSIWEQHEVMNGKSHVVVKEGILDEKIRMEFCNDLYTAH
ncbi:uncharacterized protein N7446_010633 [Penicillium canescens]|uniref:Uncharacterized protein n=1 Tax=Penicillium canescens TaxID=5083 RepID=A0AAD6ICE5_PENCN|nr:uncharacterized protein N7446_010633 [Penicillium canescens]KAJ6041482.1 hypothetical protein N7460_006872 [Penicillium canescens]KAJ6050524.1 hypothetical protein N7446_010633 [Penicillium canescens]KAJ6064825.1 hypothetical protein N7444_000478 [Penicillium canescens]